MALTKGVHFANARSFVIETYGTQGWAETLAAFGQPDREVLESVLAIGWYDLGLYARLLRAVDQRLGDGDFKLVYAAGRYEADKNLPMFHQWVMRLLKLSPDIRHISKYWRRFHDTGEWIIERRGEREIIARLTGWGVVDVALCRELTGYIQRMLEVLGGSDVTLDHPRCRARGEVECEFRARYSFRKDREEPRTSSQTSLSRAVLLEALRSSPSLGQPASDASPSSEPVPGRFRSSRPPPSEKDSPRSDRWAEPPSSSGRPSLPRSSSLPGPLTTPLPSPPPNSPSPAPPAMPRSSPPRSSSPSDLPSAPRGGATSRSPATPEPLKPPSVAPPPSTRSRGER